MNAVYLFGAGKVGRNIIATLPYGLVKGVMDSDETKIGMIYESFTVEEVNYKWLKDMKYGVVFSFFDQIMINQCEENEIDFYFSWGVKNIYQVEEIRNNLLHSLCNRFWYDMRMKLDVNVPIMKKVQLYRNDFFSDYNKNLINTMKKGDMAAIKKELNNYYDVLEKDELLQDEKYEMRVGFQLADMIIRNIAEKYQAIKVVDIACGHGEFICKLNDVGINAEGVDVSTSRIKYLEKKGIKVTLGMAENTGLADKTYDVVTCFECLEHVVNPISVVNEIYRILNKGGVFIISVPYKRRLDCSTHVRIIDESYISQLLYEHFEITNMILIPYIYGNEYNNMFLMAKKREV